MILLRKVFFLFAVCFIPLDSFATVDAFPPWIGRGVSFEIFGQPGSTFIVSDDGYNGLDQTLTHFLGPLVAEFKIRRYVGPTDSDGLLIDAEDMIARGLISPTATIRVSAFDVDHNRDPTGGSGDTGFGRHDGSADRKPDSPVFALPRAGLRKNLRHHACGHSVPGDCDEDGLPDPLFSEHDVVYFNNEEVGHLVGYNSTWMVSSFEVPITDIRFPTAPGEVSVNTILIDVDAGNADVVLSGGSVGCNWWDVKIDWVSLEFDASPPVVLVHGIRSDAESLSEFAAGLEKEKFIVRRVNLVELPLPDPLTSEWAHCELSLPYNNSIIENVWQLKEQIVPIAELYGTDRINLIGHSKGGLDSRVFAHALEQYPPQIPVGDMDGQTTFQELRVQSLLTLNTPHRGSALADVGVAGRRALWEQGVVEPTFGAFLANIASGFEGPYYCDLTTERAWQYVTASPLSSQVQTASVATDLHRDGDPTTFSSEETEGFVPGPLASIAAALMYGVTGAVQTVTVEIEPQTGGRPDEILLSSIANPELLPNDGVVTVESASLYSVFPDISGWHHMNVASMQNATTIATDAQDASTGLLNWRAQ